MENLLENTFMCMMLYGAIMFSFVSFENIMYCIKHDNKVTKTASAIAAGLWAAFYALTL